MPPRLTVDVLRHASHTHLYFAKVVAAEQFELIGTLTSLQDEV